MKHARYRTTLPTQLVFCFLLLISPGLTAQQSLTAPPLTSGPIQLTAQQTAIVNGMTSAQIQAYVSAIQPTLSRLKSDIASHQVATVDPNWQDFIRGTATGSSQQVNVSQELAYTFVNAGGGTLTRSANAVVGPGSGSPQATCPIGGCYPRCLVNPCPSVDLDQDGLPDSLESAVADDFTPFYTSSAGEHDQFATFANYVPMTVTSLVGAVPPFSYYRVQPLGLATNASGQQVFALRIDYLTLWNADDGLIGGGAACYYSYVGLDGVVGELTGHSLDAERSGMLVAAPAVNGSYNPDPAQYSLYTVYTAAHEGTFFDQSMYGDFSIPVSAGNHLELDLSLSKHSTYVFNPDYYPITPAWFIADYNASLLALLDEEVITPDQYYLSVAIGNATFFGCAVERFSNQSGSYASQRVNVGEPAHPINGSGFIQDNSARALNLEQKLLNPIF